MATPNQLSTRANALFVAIRNKIASKLDASATAVNSLKLEGKTLSQVRAEVISEELGQINGRKGDNVFFGEEGSPMSLVGGELLTKVRMGSTDIAIDKFKSTTQSFQEVFDTWLRTSHNTSLTFPANVSETNSWSYNPETDAIAATINSVTLAGFMSPYQFDEYVFEAIVKSTGSDDDIIGMCAAFKKVGGREHTVTVTVTSGGMTPATSSSVNGPPTIFITENAMQGAANGYKLLWSQELGVPRSHFNAGPDFPSGVRIRIKRTLAGMLEVTCTRADGSAWPNPVFTTVELPTRFKGKCSIGYVAMSQPASSWENITVPTIKTDIIDTRTMMVWRWNNNSSTWVNAGTIDDNTVMMPGRFYKNTEGPDYHTYYLDREGALVTVGKSDIL